MGALLLAIACYIGSLVFMLAAQRPLFLLFNRKSNTEQLTLSDLWQIYRHGILSDFVIAGYLSAIPWLMAWVWFNAHFFSLYAVMAVYTAIAALLVSAISVSDAALYEFWHFKIEASALSYLKNPKAAFASVSGWYVAAGALAILLFALLFYVIVAGSAWLVTDGISAPRGVAQYILGNVGFLIEGVVLAVIIRGLRVRPNNPTIVLFSPNAFYNHAALNAIFSFTYSMSLKDDYSGRFRFMPDEECKAIVADLYPTQGAPTKKILRTDRPNILVIIWESFSWRFANERVTPSFMALSREGLLFTECQCGSYLTDRGVASVICGVPGQPTASIGKHTAKLPFLPGLPKTLKEHGYTTHLVHGGDLSIRQKGEIYHAAGHDDIMGISAFDAPRSAHCKWGIHDDVMADILYKKIRQWNSAPGGQPWFATWQTLSSHEPFVVPYDRLPDRMENAFAFTDAALGRLAERLKESGDWDNLLLVVVADHGVNYGSEYGKPMTRSEFPHIPLLFTGGAVKEGGVFETVMSQTDIAATLLGQMGIAHEQFPYSRDVLADSYTRPWAFHAFNHSVTLRDPDGATVIDTDTDSVTEGAPDPTRITRGHAVLQSLYSYLDSLGKNRSQENF